MAVPASAGQIGQISATMGDWCFLPVLADSGELEQILAVRTTSGVESVTAMRLFPVPDGSWAAQAWSGVPIEAAIAWTLSAETDVSAATFEPEALDAWPIDTDPAIVLHHLDFPVAPVEFADGVEATDPLAPIVQAVPGLLDALEATGYPAVARVGGATVTSGSFTAPSVGDPAQLDCLAVVALLDSLRAAFEPGAGNVQSAEAQFVDSMSAAGCGWCIPAYWTDTSPWQWSCGPWSFDGMGLPGTGRPLDCIYQWVRDAAGRQYKVTVSRDIDCNFTVCFQTRTKTCKQWRNTLTLRPDSVTPCPPNGPEPSAGIKCGCGLLDGGSTTSWEPPCE